jgi:uncharacterized protein (TIGR02265 family)
VSNEQRLVFEQPVEGMYLKGHPELLTPQVKDAIRAVGIDLDQKLKPFYPSEMVNEATRVFRKLAYAREPDDAKAYTRMGERIVDGYFNTVLGKAMVGVLKLFGARRIVGRLPQTMKAGTNFQEVTIDWKGDTEAWLTLADTEPDPHLNVGVIQRAFVHWFSVPSMKVEIVEHVRPKATYRLNWMA